MSSGHGPGVTETTGPTRSRKAVSIITGTTIITTIQVPRMRRRAGTCIIMIPAWAGIHITMIPAWVAAAVDLMREVAAAMGTTEEA